MSRFLVVFVAILLLYAVGNILSIPRTYEQISQQEEQCGDFYTYVCGGGELTKERIKSAVSSQTEALDLLEKYRLKAAHLTATEKKMYDWREQCLKPVGSTRRKEFIQRFNFPNSIDGWPAYNKNWTARKFNLQNAIAELASYGTPVIINIEMVPDRKTFASRILIKALHPKYFLTEQNRSSMKIRLYRYVDNIDEVLDDSTVVSNWYINTNYEEYKESLQTNFKGLKTALPEINWDKQVEAVFAHQVPDDFPVTVQEFQVLKKVLLQAFQTDPKIMANYMLYRFASDLPIVDEHNTNTNFIYGLLPTLVKQSYTNLGNVDELRNMLYVILKNLHKAELLFNNDSEANFETRIASYLKETIPTVDYAYYDDAFGKFEVGTRDCYYETIKLQPIFVKLENEKIWKFGSLSRLQFTVAHTFMSELSAVANSSSAYKFRNLAWTPIRTFIKNLEDGLSKHKLLKDCEKQTVYKRNAGDYMDYLGIPLMVQSYFDWAKTNVKLVELESEKFGRDSKTSLMERLMLSYCHEDIKEPVSRKLSWYFTNLELFRETFHCHCEVPFTVENKCISNWYLMYN